MKLRFSILVFLASLVCVSLWGQVKASLDSEELLMGNTMKLHLLVPLSSDSAKVEFPLLKQAEAQKKKYVPILGDSVEIRLPYSRALEEEDGRFWMRYDLSIQSFDSGRFELPPFDFIVDGKSVSSNQVSLSVLPVKVKADDKIDDFSSVIPPFELNPNPEDLEEEGAFALIWWIIAGAILILLGAVGYLLLKKKGNIFKMTAPPSPYQVAIEKLKKLKSQDLPQRGKTKEYYTRLTNILRVYLKKQFNIKTYEKTSSEILMQVDADDRIEEFGPLLKGIFETADFVKFAKVNPLDVENNRCLDDAERFVNLSHPQDMDNEKKGGGK